MKKVLDLFSGITRVPTRLGHNAFDPAASGTWGTGSTPYLAWCFLTSAMLHSGDAQAYGRYPAHAAHRRTGIGAGHLDVEHRSASGCHQVQVSRGTSCGIAPCSRDSSRKTLNGSLWRFLLRIGSSNATGLRPLSTLSRSASRTDDNVARTISPPSSAASETSSCRYRSRIFAKRLKVQTPLRNTRNASILRMS